MTSYSFFFTLIDKIPGSLWGVVLGSFFSLAGVALTNRASDKRLLAQFQHEQKQKTIDREMALRKEVYLAAAEAIAAGTNVVSQLVNLDLPNDKLIADYAAKAPAIAKAHIIAKTKTMQTLANFTGELGVIYLKLSAKRYELMIEKTQIAVLDNQTAESLKAQNRNLEMITQYNIDGVVDDRLRQTLQRNFEFRQKRIDEAIAHRDGLGRSLYVKQLEFMRECALDTMRLGRLVVPVLSALREELQLPFDEESYRQILEDGLSKQKFAIDEFIQKFTGVIVEPTV